MDFPEANTHSFVVKIWLEEIADKGQKAIWRGHITHVPGGERSYIKDLDDVTNYIAIYLEGMGVTLGIKWRVRRWLWRFRIYLKTRN